MAYGIKTTSGAATTIDSTKRVPMIEVTSDPKRFASLPYTFKAEPPNGTAQTLFELPHGYTYPPAAIVSYATDYQTTTDTGEFRGAPGRYSTLEFFVSASDLIVPPGTLVEDIYRIYAYCDNKNLYIKVLRDSDSALLTSIVGSTWHFTYRIYALTG